MRQNGICNDQRRTKRQNGTCIDQHPMMRQNGTCIDQRPEKHQGILARIAPLRQTLARQGAVVESWRYRGGQRLGPYYRLAYYEDNRPRSIYLGRSEQLASTVRGLLADLQAPMRRTQARQRVYDNLRKEHRRHQALWRNQLRARGLYTRGYVVRGWRRLKHAIARVGRVSNLPSPVGQVSNLPTPAAMLPTAHTNPKRQRGLRLFSPPAIHKPTEHSPANAAMDRAVGARNESRARPNPVQHSRFFQLQPQQGPLLGRGIAVKQPGWPDVNAHHGPHGPSRAQGPEADPRMHPDLHAARRFATMKPMKGPSHEGLHNLPQEPVLSAAPPRDVWKRTSRPP